MSNGGNCALAFNAMYGDPGFVTASHCTSIMGQMDGGSWGQPDLSNGVGYEEKDSPFTYMSSYGCPNSAQCGFSDAAYIRNPYGETPYASRRIVLEDGSGTGRLVSTNPNDWYYISGVVATPMVGEGIFVGAPFRLENIGSVRGLCTGPYTVSSNMNLRLVCHSTADYETFLGDSGSPVFAKTTGGNVLLYGVHSGRATINNESLAIFSDIHQVLNALTIALL